MVIFPHQLQCLLVRSSITRRESGLIDAKGGGERGKIRTTTVRPCECVEGELVQSENQRQLLLASLSGKPPSLTEVITISILTFCKIHLS